MLTDVLGENILRLIMWIINESVWIMNHGGVGGGGAEKGEHPWALWIDLAVHTPSLVNRVVLF